MESQKISQKHPITSKFIETLSKYHKLDPTFLCDLQFSVPVQTPKTIQIWIFKISQSQPMYPRFRAKIGLDMKIKQDYWQRFSLLVL